MTIPKKRRRNITVEGEAYHWAHNHETKWQGSTAIQSATGVGSIIEGIVLGELKPADIESAIRFAKRHDWKPACNSNLSLFINADAIPTEISIVPDLKNGELRRKWIVVTRSLLTARRLISRGIENADFENFNEYLEHNELELALDELVRIGKSSTDVDGWRWLGFAAEEMELENQAKVIQEFASRI